MYASMAKIAKRLVCNGHTDDYEDDEFVEHKEDDSVWLGHQQRFTH